MPALLAPTPRMGAVFREQVRTVALSLRYEAVAAVAVLSAYSAVYLPSDKGEGDALLWLSPWAFWPIVILGLFVPLSVWRGEPPSGRDYHRAMPVGQAAHALARTAAGLLWLLGLTVGYGAWIASLGWATGGGIAHLYDEWRWLAPATAILCTYFLGSAVALVSGRAWAWVTGAALYLVLAISMGDGEGFVGRALGALFAPVFGRFGLIGLSTGRVPLPMKSPHHVDWATFADWLPVAWLWLSVSAAAFGATVWRQKG